MQNDMIFDEANPSRAYLNAHQLRRLHRFLVERRQVDGRGNFPTLEMSVRQFVNVLLERLGRDGVIVGAVKMNGGCAAHILSGDEVSYNDVDLIFSTDLSKAHHLDVIKECVLASLVEFMPDGISLAKISLQSMKDAYVRKMVKVCDEDLWSLISLNNEAGRSLELKFVHRMRRQFEFSVDSFQIHLCNLLNVVDEDELALSSWPGDEAAPAAPAVSVMSESVFGDFQLAYYHLNNRLIDTKQPELIRGGGLLKYCQLLAQDYQVALTAAKRWRQTERYMCSRFFIDFPTTMDQQRKLQCYLANHFLDDGKAKYDFLAILYRVVEESTVCLMNHDLRMTLLTIENFMYQVSMSSFMSHCAAAAAAAAAGGQPTAAASAAAMISVANVAPAGAQVVSVGMPGASVQQADGVVTSSADQQQATGNNAMPLPSNNGGAVHQPKQTLLYVPKNASYWVSVM